MHHGTIALLQLDEHLGQFVERLAFKLLAQFGILGHGRQLVALQHGLDIEPCAATEDGHCSTTPDVLIGIEEVLLILKQVVLRAWLADVNQMIGDVDGGLRATLRPRGRRTVDHQTIIIQVLARADIHPTIDLTGIGRDNLPANLVGQSSCQWRLATGRRTEYRYHPLHIVCKDKKKIPSDKIQTAFS